MSQNLPESSAHQVPSLTLYEEEIYSVAQDKDIYKQFVMFPLGIEWYGIDVLKVTEVLSTSHVTRLPFVPNHILGIINYKGNVLSVVSLTSFLGLSTREIKNPKSQIIIIEQVDLMIGLWIDGTAETVEISENKISEYAGWTSANKQDVLIGQFECSNRIVGILDARLVIEKTRLQGSKEK